MCDKFKWCIAFDFGNDAGGYNSLRFRSVSALTAAAKSSGWGSWDGECQSDCKVTVTTGVTKPGGQCWVKDSIPGWYVSCPISFSTCVRSRSSMSTHVMHYMLYAVPAGAIFLGGDGALQKDRSVATSISLPTDFEIGFDIIPNPSTAVNMSSIVTFANGRDSKAKDHSQIRVTFLPNSHRLMVGDGSSESVHWPCNNSVMTLGANVVSRVQLALQKKSVSVYINGKVACWNIPRQDRKALNNVTVYLSDPYLPAANAMVADLYLWQLRFAGQQST